MARNIVFVCLGNICRSPMAEFVMKDLVEKAGLTTDFHIESRATSSWEHGNPVHPGTKNVLEIHQVAVSPAKSSQQISVVDFEKFDVIVAMDASNLENLYKMVPKGTEHKLQMLLEESVPDPWYTGDFEETYRLVNEGCQRLLK
jgi:protein-tyrosine phosphatase